MEMFYNLGARSGHMHRWMSTLPLIQVEQLYASVACTYKSCMYLQQLHALYKSCIYLQKLHILTKVACTYKSCMYLQKYACTTRPLDKIA